MTYCINYDIICTYLRGDGMLLYILWQCGLVLSTFINIPMSALAYMRFRLKDKEFYNYLKNRSLKDKILFNIKNAVRFFLPIYNIIYPIKLLSCGGLKYVMAKWKKEILNSAKNKNSACVLMHDSSVKTTTVQALPEIIEGLTAMGYRFEALTPETYGYHHRNLNN